MKMERFSPQTQEGLRLWCQEAHGVEPEWLDSLKHAEDWAWVYFLVAASDNRREWFPHSKGAFLQHLHNLLLEEAGPLVGRPVVYAESARALAREAQSEPQSGEAQSTYVHPSEEAADAPHTVADEADTHAPV